MSSGEISVDLGEEFSHQTLSCGFAPIREDGVIVRWVTLPKTGRKAFASPSCVPRASHYLDLLSTWNLL